MPAVAVRKHARESASRGSLPGRLLRYVATLLSLYNICSRRLYWGWLMQMLNVWRCWCKQHSRLDRGLTGLTPFSMHRGAWIPAQRRHPHVPRTAPCSYPQFWYLEWLFFTGQPSCMMIHASRLFDCISEHQQAFPLTLVQMCDLMFQISNNTERKSLVRPSISSK